METQHTNPQSSSKLNENEETNPDLLSSSNQKPSEEKTSNARNQTLRSGSKAEENLKNARKRQDQAQPKSLDYYLETLYKMVIVMYILISAGSIIFVIVAVFKGVEFDQFGLFVVCWSLAQYLYAFLGVLKKDLKKIERAYKMMEIYFFLVGIASLKKGLEVMEKEDGGDGNPVFGVLKARVLQVIFYTVLVFLPTRKVRSILKDNRKKTKKA